MHPLFTHMDRAMYARNHPPPEVREPPESVFKNPEAFPEEFWTNSVIHISKLSDREFKRRKDYLKTRLEKRVDWDEETQSPFLTTLAKRGSCSLPLPLPIPLENVGHKDLMAIFSKMHSRAFVRSHRLRKSVYRLLIEHSTKFNIRLRRGNLAFFSGNGGKDNMWYCPANQNYRFDIDPITILPFTFDGIKSYWDGNSFLDVFSRMKWAFTKIELRLRDGSPKMRKKPWMFGMELSFFKSPNLETLKSVVKEMKPKKITHSSHLTSLTYLAEQVNARFSLTLPFVTDAVMKWRSGNWNYNAVTIEATYLSTIAGFLAAVSGDRTRIHTAADGSMTVLVADPNNRYLVLILGSTKYESARHSINLSMHSNIYSLNDFGNIRSTAQSQIPVDYSAYKGDPDSGLDGRAFIELLVGYDRERYPVHVEIPDLEREGTLEPFPRSESGPIRTVQRMPLAGQRRPVKRHHPYNKQ